MTDIVERLRGEATLLETHSASWVVHLPTLLIEAADQITRHREAIEQIAGLTMSMFPKVSDLAQRQKEIAVEAMGVRHD